VFRFAGDTLRYFDTYPLGICARWQWRGIDNAQQQDRGVFIVRNEGVILLDASRDEKA